jgi:K+-sensing histidine kinase KdpD
MIGNMLDLTRLEAGIVEYDVQPTDIAEMMHGVLLELHAAVRQKSLGVLASIQHEPLLIDCDPNRIAREVVQNRIELSQRAAKQQT